MFLSVTQHKDDPVASSFEFERDEQGLVAGGWQPELAYDLCIANLDPSVTPTPPPETLAPVLDRFPDGLTTAEVAALLARGPDYIPDHEAAEEALVRLLADGEVTRLQLGGGVLWRWPVEGEPTAGERATTVAA